jgi:glycosidase
MLTFNSRNLKYKTPFGACPSETVVKFNFPVPQSFDARAVFLVYSGKQNGRIEFNKTGEENGFAVFSGELYLGSEGIYWYRFEVVLNNGNIKHIGNDGLGGAAVGQYPCWQQTVYKKGFSTPDYLKGGVIYQIFPDRFARVDDDKLPTSGYLKSWIDDVTVADSDGVYRANDFFGGNIKGVISKLGYLKELGVTAIYFCPFNLSSSNHRYDIADYLKIDPLFGNEDEFKELICKADKLGIAVILDGVFNHTGADSVYFNKFMRYGSGGAFNDKNSPYFNWYSFTTYPHEYACWWGVTVVPEIRRDALDFQNFIAGERGVIEHWNKLGVKGWRLDVVDEITDDFVKKIRHRIKSFDENIVLIGEVWEDASTKESYGEKREYFLGNGLDGVMNYVYKTAILDYLRVVNPKKFKSEILNILENYPKDALDCCMTLISSHDTNRIINELSGAVPHGDKKKRLNYRLTKEEYEKGRAKTILASTIQYMLPGVPMLYYGDEAGVQGFDDPINRRPFPKNPDMVLTNHYKRLGYIRQNFKEEFLKNTDISQIGGAITITRGNLTAAVNPLNASFKLNKEVYDLLSEQYVDEIKPFSAVVWSLK